jgi:hypothetical protein
VWWHNNCATKHSIKIDISHGSDGCFTTGGHKSGSHKFKPFAFWTWAGLHSAKQVKKC